MRIALLVLFMYLLQGCAQVHKDIEARQTAPDHLESPLKISAEVNNRLSSEYFGMIEFTIENRSDKWIEIKQFDVNAGKAQNRQILFTVGKDFELWSKATLARNKTEDFNTALAYSAILLSAAVTSHNAASKSVSDTAKVVGGVTATSMGIEAVNRLRADAEGAAIIPEGNILQQHIRVPPGLFVNAWLLINTTDHENNPPITALFLQAKYEDGHAENFEIPLYRKDTDLGRYKWQSISQKYMKTGFANRK